MMASRLLARPTEMHFSILTCLPYFDLHTLRLNNKYFYALIPPPINAKLFLAAISDFEILTTMHATLSCLSRPGDTVLPASNAEFDHHHILRSVITYLLKYWKVMNYFLLDARHVDKLRSQIND